MEKAIEYLRGSHDFAGFTDRPVKSPQQEEFYDIIVRQDGLDLELSIPEVDLCIIW